VKALAVLGLELRVSGNDSEFLSSVCELAFVAVLTSAHLGKASTQLRLVPRGHRTGHCGRGRVESYQLLVGLLYRLTVTPVQLLVLFVYVIAINCVICLRALIRGQTSGQSERRLSIGVMDAVMDTVVDTVVDTIVDTIMYTVVDTIVNTVVNTERALRWHYWHCWR